MMFKVKDIFLYLGILKENIFGNEINCLVIMIMVKNTGPATDSLEYIQVLLLTSCIRLKNYLSL